MPVKKIRYAVVVLCAVVFVATLVAFRGKSRKSCCEKVVEFSYSRTQPCNTNYYNYGFSVGPLRDLLMYWNGTLKSDFREGARARFKAIAESASLRLSDEDVDRLCRGVEFSMAGDKDFVHPIPCRMTVRGDGEAVEVGLLALAYRESMLSYVEVENAVTAEKATMAKLSVFQHCQRKVDEIRKQLSSPGLNSNEVERLNGKLEEVCKEARKAKAEWDAEMQIYRGKWDASIVFQE